MSGITGLGSAAAAWTPPRREAEVKRRAVAYEQLVHDNLLVSLNSAPTFLDGDIRTLSAAALVSRRLNKVFTEPLYKAAVLAYAKSLKDAKHHEGETFFNFFNRINGRFQILKLNTHQQLIPVGKNKAEDANARREMDANMKLIGEGLNAGSVIVDIFSGIGLDNSTVVHPSLWDACGYNPFSISFTDQANAREMCQRAGEAFCTGGNGIAGAALKALKATLGDEHCIPITEERLDDFAARRVTVPQEMISLDTTDIPRICLGFAKLYLYCMNSESGYTIRMQNKKRRAFQAAVGVCSIVLGVYSAYFKSSNDNRLPEANMIVSGVKLIADAEPARNVVVKKGVDMAHKTASVTKSILAHIGSAAKTFWDCLTRG